MRHTLVGFVVAVLAIAAVASTVHALPLDHLLAAKAKVNGAVRMNAFTADLHADAIHQALDGTGCTITGPPRMMLVPMTKENVTPAAPNMVSSLTLNEGHADRIFVCYRVRCPVVSDLEVPTIDQFARHFGVNVTKGTRLLCAPAVHDATHCGDPEDAKCGGPCENPGQQCMVDPDPAHDGACACVDEPPCGQAGPACVEGHCPAGFTCGSKSGSGRCQCLPACDASVDCEGYCGGKAECFDVGSGCQCVTPCGVAPQCAIGTCPNGQTCQGPDGNCFCQ